MQNSFTKPTEHKLKPFRTNKISKRKKVEKQNIYQTGSTKLKTNNGT